MPVRIGCPARSSLLCSAEKTAREPEATTTAAYAAAMSIARTSLKRFAQSESMFLMSAMPVRRLISVLCSRLSSHQVISVSRSGLSTSEEEIARLNRIITPLVKQGHSIHEIYITHQDELMCSEKTIYNYIDDCLLEVRNIDLPRKVRFRARRKKPEFKVDKGCRLGRSYKEFELFMEKNPDTAVVQMDSVIGTAGGKCLLTIHFVESSLMLAFLRDANTSRPIHPDP